MVLVAATAASGVNLVSSQRAVIPHYSLHGYGNGISSRYFDKVETGLGLGYGVEYGLGGLGYNNLGLEGLDCDNLGLGMGYENLGLGYEGLGLAY